MGKYVPYPISAKEDLLSYHIWGFKKYQSRAYPLGKGLEVTIQTLYRELLESTVMVPVPLHTDKLNERGYNQSLELAKVVGDSLDITVREILFKTRDVDMRALNWEERKDAVNGLYALQSSAVNDVRSQKILLVDDVVTTGFTVSECAQVLKDAGADSVNVLAAGRTVI
jgi:ComF family protein